MLEIGILLLIGALLAIFAARALFLQPSPPRWATWDTPGNLIVVVITAMAGLGLAATGVGIVRVVDGSVPLWHGLIAGLVIAGAIGATVAVRHWRRRPLSPAG